MIGVDKQYSLIDLAAHSVYLIIYETCPWYFGGSKQSGFCVNWVNISLGEGSTKHTVSSH